MIIMTVYDLKIIDIPKIEDNRGNLSVIEAGLLPFEFKRVYYLYDVPSGTYRGAHAHKEQWEFLIALSGSFTVVLQDVNGDKVGVTLNKPNEGLLIPRMLWRELEGFSSGSVCMVVASDVYDEGDYIRDYNDYINYN